MNCNYIFGVENHGKNQTSYRRRRIQSSTDDDLDYVAQLGSELDEKITALMHANSRISVTQAAIVTALEYADAAKKCEVTAENLRTQIQEYLEDAARARTDVEILRRESERLSKELAALKSAK